MNAQQQFKSLVVMLAFEWQLCREDPFLFCYRMGWSIFAPSSGDSKSYGDIQPWSDRSSI
jgi:hypothetical protein